MFIIGAISNALRGGQWRIWFGLKDRYGWVNSDAINAAIFMATVYWLTGNLYLSLASFPAMWLGASIGWGDYIGALGGWRKDALQEWKPIDLLITPLKRWPRVWGFAGLSLRGQLWGTIIAIPFFYFGYHATAFKFIYLGSTMGICYLAAIEWMRTRIPTGEWQGAGWGIGEIFFGGILWSALL